MLERPQASRRYEPKIYFNHIWDVIVRFSRSPSWVLDRIAGIEPRKSNSSPLNSENKTVAATDSNASSENQDVKPPDDSLKADVEPPTDDEKTDVKPRTDGENIDANIRIDSEHTDASLRIDSDVLKAIDGCVDGWIDNADEIECGGMGKTRINGRNLITNGMGDSRI